MSDAGFIVFSFRTLTAYGRPYSGDVGGVSQQVMRPGHEVARSSLCTAAVKNDRIYTYSPPLPRIAFYLVWRLVEKGRS